MTKESSNEKPQSDIPNRLRRIIDYKLGKRGMFTQLEQATGITRAAWNHIYNGRNKPNMDTLEQLCLLYPEYTLWLMTGRINSNTGQTSPDEEQLIELQKKLND